MNTIRISEEQIKFIASHLTMCLELFRICNNKELEKEVLGCLESLIVESDSRSELDEELLDVSYDGDKFDIGFINKHPLNIFIHNNLLHSMVASALAYRDVQLKYPADATGICSNPILFRRFAFPIANKYLKEMTEHGLDRLSFKDN